MRATLPGICALSAILLFGCDHGKEPLAKGADAEALGNFVEAAAQYRAVCEKGSSLCPIATRGLERIKLTEADKVLSSGDYTKAKAAIDRAVATTDAGVKRAAEEMNKLPELEKGLAWEAASASVKPDEVFAVMEGLAGASVAVSPKAREWLEKNRPRVLLDRIKAACAPQGAGACAELGRELARLHPTSPESAEANKLVEADYARVFPRLQEAENLIGQQVTIYEKDKKIYWCMRSEANDSDPGGTSELPLESLNASFRAGCEAQVPSEGVPSADFLRKAWEKKLDEIHDPSFTTQFKERMERAGKEGQFDREPWPKPAGKK